nr:hybrid signal transduction histidine kinase M [Tanacetum cinerariifolium]
MVIFVVNGLDSRFATLAKIIHHREPLPTFETVRNMLLLKESSFNDDSTSTTFEISSSSPSIRMVSSSSNAKGDLYPVTKSSNLPVALPVPPIGTNVSVTPRMKGFVLLLLVILFLKIKRSLHMFAMLVSLSDLWTSPIVNSSGFKYYVFFLDHFSHYVWIYPLKHKFDML